MSPSGRVQGAGVQALACHPGCSRFDGNKLKLELQPLLERAWVSFSASASRNGLKAAFVSATLGVPLCKRSGLMARFERVHLDLAEWGRILHTFHDAVVFQSPAWLSFLAETQKAELVFGALKEGTETIGYLSGLMVRKFGLKIFGSPFPGWSTPYMGFNVRPGVPRRTAVDAVEEFVFGGLGCLHFEIVDSRLSSTDVAGIDVSPPMNATMEVDLTQSEDDLLAHMTASCRRNVRKAEKNELRIEEAHGEQFADEYSEQLKDVFAKQGLVPHFGFDRVKVLLKHLEPTTMVLLLRARDPQGRCIATGIYPAMNETAFYWGGASWREYQKLYPNELLHWHAMRYWKRRGMKAYNLVGTMEFKQRFGGVQTSVPVIRKSRFRVVSVLRSRAPALVRGVMALAWKARKFARAG